MVEAPMRVKSSGLVRYTVGGAALVALVVVALMPAMASMRGCEGSGDGKVQAVKIGGEWFHLEVAADEPTRMKGLGQRDFIEDTGGMLFVFDKDFPRKYPSGTGFVMRDCPIDIDIIYLDPNARVVKMYAMKKEPPRGPDEGKIGDFSNEKYEKRLKQYPSGHAILMAIELKGGTLERLKGKIKEGEKIDLPLEELKKRATP